MAEKHKLNKDDVLYGFPEPLGTGKNCGNCDNFEPVPGTEDGAGTCRRINGICQLHCGCLDFTQLVPNRPQQQCGN